MAALCANMSETGGWVEISEQGGEGIWGNRGAAPRDARVSGLPTRRWWGWIGRETFRPADPLRRRQGSQDLELVPFEGRLARDQTRIVNSRRDSPVRHVVHERFPPSFLYADGEEMPARVHLLPDSRHHDLRVSNRLEIFRSDLTASCRPARQPGKHRAGEDRGVEFVEPAVQAAHNDEAEGFTGFRFLSQREYRSKRVVEPQA
jgi:hypothetical protein